MKPPADIQLHIQSCSNGYVVSDRRGSMSTERPLFVAETVEKLATLVTMLAKGYLPDEQGKAEVS